MKKTFTRALSLLLVLVALIGVMPTAFAVTTEDFGSGAITLTADKTTVKPGETVTLTADVPYDSDRFEAPVVEWGVEDGAGTIAANPGNPMQATFTAGENIATFNVAMTATALGAQSGNPFTVEKTVAITIEAAGSGEGGETEEHAYSVTVDPAELTLAVDEESEPLEVIVKDGDMVLSSDKYTLEGFVAAKVDGKEIVSVNGDGVVKGLAEGETIVEATVTIKEGNAEVSGQVKVTVGSKTNAVIDYNPKAAKVTEKATLTPVLKIDGVAVYDAKFKFEKTAMNTSITVDGLKHSASIGTNLPGVVEIQISVEEYKLKQSDSSYIPGTDIEPITAYVRFYETVDMTLTIVSGKTKFALTDEKVFSKVVVDNEEQTSTVTGFSFQNLLGRYMPAKDVERPNDDAKRPYIVYFDASSSAASGQVEDRFGQRITYKEWSFLDQANFAQIDTRTGTTTVAYKVVDTNGLTMLTGYVSFVITGGEGDIHYETTYNKPITLKETDFQQFWADLKLGNQFTLSYVTFDVSGLTGKLYTDSTKKVPVTSSTKFYIFPARGEYDLGSVYYVPDAKKTTEYTDSINFTAVSIYEDTRQVGTVTITLNAKSSSITSRGMVFSTTYTNQINQAYKDNTGSKALGYVIFDLPEAKYGKLYTKLPVVGSNTKVAEGILLEKGEKLYYSPVKADELPLKEAAFIPAAGFSGEVLLTYTAYDAYGYNEYKGILRVNVTKKTASGVFSDVNSRNYSWAADSVDFLYYEGTAQGSNGKYNPAANITRRDFMLMLYRAFLADDYSTFRVTSNFPDVVKGADAYSQEIYQAVGVAKYLGIAQGSNDKFNPKDNITRQEAMVLIYRTLDVIRKDLDYTVTTNVTAFKDYNKISSWATTAINYLVGHGVIQGTNDMIKPTANITRAEMACILHRVLTY